MEPVSGSANERAQSRGVAHPAAGEEPLDPLRSGPGARRPISELRGGSDARARDRQRKRGSSTALQDATSACTPARIAELVGRRAAGRWRACRPGRAVRGGRPRCQSTSSGLALKIDEYVPEMMPMSRASTNGDRRHRTGTGRAG